MAAPQLWKLTLYVETDHVAEVERLADAISRLACPVPTEEVHACQLPWFVISSELGDDEDTATIRELLNR